jgi:hypothetical protein
VSRATIERFHGALARLDSATTPFLRAKVLSQAAARLQRVSERG